MKVIAILSKAIDENKNALSTSVRYFYLCALAIYITNIVIAIFLVSDAGPVVNR
jgi:hypothetical protein